MAMELRPYQKRAFVAVATAFLNRAVNKQVIVGSVASLGRAKTARLKDYAPSDFCLLVTDEAHHAANDSYMNIYRHFGVLKSEPEHDWNRDLLHLGVTATPSRTDNKGIDQV